MQIKIKYKSHIVKWNINRSGHLDGIQLAGQCSQGCAELWHYFREEKAKHVTISGMLVMPLWSGICSTGWTETVISKGQAVFPWMLKLDGVEWLWLSTRVPEDVCLSQDTPGSTGWAGGTKRAQEVETGKDKQDYFLQLFTALPPHQVSLCSPLLLCGGAVSTVWSCCTMRGKCSYHVG